MKFYLIKILDWILVAIVAILVFMSLAALIVIHNTLFTEYKFSFSPVGFETYLKSYENYITLFAATIAMITAYFGLHRLKAATDANDDKLRLDRFSEWKTVLDIRFIEIEKFDPFMKREFIRSRYNLFQLLYPINFNIRNHNQLLQVFEIFRDRIPFFEEMNDRYMKKAGIYRTNTYGYAFESFRFLVFGCFEEFYTNAENDLLVMYLAAMSPHRTIDAKMYNDMKT